ncbi:MAG: hypothetical protein ACYSW6_08855 [Planctomycetota bacterium]
MANQDKPNGFKPVRHLISGGYNGQYNIYYKQAALNEVHNVGDAVASAGSADSTGKYSDIALAAAGSPIRGVIVGFGTTPQVMAQVSDLSRRAAPALTEMYVAVVDDPFVIFEVQEDGDSTPITVAGIGNNVKGVYTAGTETSGSIHEIDSDGSLGTAVNDLRILRLVNREDNELGAYARWEVLINDHELNEHGAVGD